MEGQYCARTLSRFPHATQEELLQAHSYAYGGAIIQDFGYYPFGSHFFSDLTHYVRSGDFVLALIEESENLNDYAFALGALSHYAADASGHPLATNLGVAIMYPKLEKKYGPIVTYEDKPPAHTKVEYGFDVDQVAEGNYAPKAYHDFVGFEVSKAVLETAFARTYSLDLSSILFHEDLAIGSYRHAVSTLIPSTTKVAWHLKRDEIQNSQPNETKRKFVYNISRSGYRKEWGHIYEKPGAFARTQALFLRVVPKIGPFSGLAFHPPTPAVEQLYMSSFNDALDHFERCSWRNRNTGSNCPTRTLIQEQLPEQPNIDSLTKLMPNCSARQAGNPFPTLCGGTFSPFTPIWKSRLQPNGTRRLGRSSSGNWIG